MFVSYRVSTVDAIILLSACQLVRSPVSRRHKPIQRNCWRFVFKICCLPNYYYNYPFFLFEVRARELAFVIFGVPTISLSSSLPVWEWAGLLPFGLMDSTQSKHMRFRSLKLFRNEWNKMNSDSGRMRWASRLSPVFMVLGPCQWNLLISDRSLLCLIGDYCCCDITSKVKLRNAGTRVAHSHWIMKFMHGPGPWICHFPFERDEKKSPSKSI